MILKNWSQKERTKHLIQKAETDFDLLVNSTQVPSTHYHMALYAAAGFELVLVKVNLYATK